MAIDFTMTEEQELLLSSIRELINNEFPEEYFRTHDEEGKYPREFVKALAENGISLLGVPEEHGGIPADYVTQMLAIMEIAKCGAPAFLMTNGQCMHSMIHFGSPEQLRLTAAAEQHRRIAQRIVGTDAAAGHLHPKTNPDTRPRSDDPHGIRADAVGILTLDGYDRRRQSGAQKQNSQFHCHLSI